MKVFEVFGGEVRVVISDRLDGNMRVFDERERDGVLDNQARVGEALGVGRDMLLRVRCGYAREDFVRYVNKPDAKKFCFLNEGDVPESDGMLVRGSGVGMILPLADCLGMVLYDVRRKVLMLVHAGRHNLEQDGAFEAVRFMERNGCKSVDVLAFFSPAAGKGNFPVYKLGGMGLVEAAVEQLVRAGVGRGNIEDLGIDTTVDEGYFSYSQGDKKLRFAIGVRMVK